MKARERSSKAHISMGVLIVVPSNYCASSNVPHQARDLIVWKLKLLPSYPCRYYSMT